MGCLKALECLKRRLNKIRWPKQRPVPIDIGHIQSNQWFTQDQIHSKPCPCPYFMPSGSNLFRVDWHFAASLPCLQWTVVAKSCHMWFHWDWVHTLTSARKIWLVYLVTKYWCAVLAHLSWTSNCLSAFSDSSSLIATKHDSTSNKSVLKLLTFVALSFDGGCLPHSTQDNVFSTSSEIVHVIFPGCRTGLIWRIAPSEKTWEPEAK